MEAGGFQWPRSSDELRKLTATEFHMLMQGFSIAYSIAETAKENNLRPYEYFEHLFEVIPQHQEDTDLSFLDDLLPWSPNLPMKCRKSKDEIKK